MTIPNLRQFFTYVFSLSLGLSVALNNIGLAGGALFFLLQKGEIKSVYKQNKGIVNALGIFWLTLLPSVFFKNSVLLGLKEFSSIYVFRFLPLFLGMMLYSKREAIRKNNNLIKISIAIAAVHAVYQGFFLHMWRVKAFFNNPMILAGVLGLGLSLVCIEYFKTDDNKKEKIINFCLLFLFLLALAFNATRGIWLAVLGIGLFILLTTPNSKRKLLFIFLVVALGSYFAMTSTYFTKRINSIDDMSSNRERILIWKSAQSMCWDNPWFGVGMGNYTLAYQTKYISPQAKEPYLRHAHNIYLQILAENGIVGFAGFCYFFGYVLYCSYREYRKYHSNYALLSICITMSVLIHGLTEYVFANINVVHLYTFLLGEAFGQYSKAQAGLYDETNSIASDK